MNNEVLMPRDEKAIQFIGSFGLASVNQLAEAVYRTDKSSVCVARRRLKILAEHKLIGRIRYGDHLEYCYYTGRKPPERKEHHLLLVDVYIALLRLGGQIERWEREPDWGDLRPDAYCVYWFSGKRMHFAVEVQRDKPFSQSKYEQDYAMQKRATQRRFPSYPKVLVVAEKPFTPAPSEIPFIVVPTSLTGIEKIIK